MHVLHALLSALLVISTAAFAADGAPSSDAALAPYISLRADAQAITQEIDKRITWMERQDSDTRAESAKLQIQLGQWMTESKSIQENLNHAEASMRQKESIVVDAQRQRDAIERDRQNLQNEIRKKQDESVTCYIPFAQLYCLIADLSGQLRSLDDRLRATHERMFAVMRDRDEASAKLAELKAYMGLLEANQTSARDAIADGEKKLIALHAALEKYRTASQKHRLAFDGFASQLNQIDAAPGMVDPDDLDRRLSRLHKELADEIVQACGVLKEYGPALPGDVQKACHAA